MGTVKEVKPLGVIAMIDDGELDWKVCFVLFYLFNVTLTELVQSSPLKHI